MLHFGATAVAGPDPLGRGGGTNSEKPHSPHRQCQPHTRKRPEIDPNTPSPWQQPRGFCWRGVLQDTAPTGHPPAALPHQVPSGCGILRLRGSKLGEGTRLASSWGPPPPSRASCRGRGRRAAERSLQERTNTQQKRTLNPTQEWCRARKAVRDAVA